MPIFPCDAVLKLLSVRIIIILTRELRFILLPRVLILIIVLVFLPIFHSSPASFNSHNYYYSYYTHSQSYTAHTQTAQQVTVSLRTKYFQMTWPDFHDLSNRFNMSSNGTILKNPLHDDHALPHARPLESSLRAWAVLTMYCSDSQFRETILYLTPFKFREPNIRISQSGQSLFFPLHKHSATNWHNWNETPIVGLLLG